MNEERKAAIKRILSFGLPVPWFFRPLLRTMHQWGVGCVEAGTFIRKIFWVEPVLRSIATSVGRGLRADRLPYIRGTGRLVLGDDVVLSGRSCFFFMDVKGSEPVISIGDRVFIGHGCTFSAARSITVGRDVLISAGVRIHDNDGHPLDAEKRMRGEKITSAEIAEVVIENGAWIGAQAIILKGARVGRNAIVGAGAVVTSDVPAGRVFAGNPAREVKRLAGGSE